jgi:hypothetical protein
MKTYFAPIFVCGTMGVGQTLPEQAECGASEEAKAED